MKLLKFSGLIGIAGPFIVFAFILSAIASWEHFNWFNNALSDLGVQGDSTAIIFNSGLVVGGFLFALFGTGLFQYVGNRLIGKIGTLSFVAACINLMGIGIFNENYDPTHYILSVTFFTLFPIAMLILVGAFWIEGKRKLSIFTLALALASATVWGLQLTIQYVSNVAIPEFVSGLFGAAWVMAVSYLMLKESSKTTALRNSS